MLVNKPVFNAEDLTPGTCVSIHLSGSYNKIRGFVTSCDYTTLSVCAHINSDIDSEEHWALRELDGNIYSMGGISVVSLYIPVEDVASNKVSVTLLVEQEKDTAPTEQGSSDGVPF